MLKSGTNSVQISMYNQNLKSSIGYEGIDQIHAKETAI